MSTKRWPHLAIGGAVEAFAIADLLHFVNDTGDILTAEHAACGGELNSELALYLLRRGWQVPGWRLDTEGGLPTAERVAVQPPLIPGVRKAGQGGPTG